MKPQVINTPTRQSVKQSNLHPQYISHNQVPLHQQILQNNNNNSSTINTPIKRNMQGVPQQGNNSIIINRPPQNQQTMKNSQIQNKNHTSNQLLNNSQYQPQSQQSTPQRKSQQTISPQINKNQQIQQPVRQSQFHPQNVSQLKNSQFPQIINQSPIHYLNNQQQPPVRKSQYNQQDSNNVRNSQFPFQHQQPMIFNPAGQQPFQYVYQHPQKIQERVYNHTNFASLQQMLNAQNKVETIKNEIKGPLLPPKTCDKQYTLVLDLDETLIHTYDLNEEKVDFYIRPFCREFLKNASEHFEIVTFTAALKDYADVVIDNLDTENLIQHRLYRHHTRAIDGKIKKDLSIIGRPLHTTMIVDNLEQNFSLQKQNGYYIPDFTTDSTDTHLQDLDIFLKIIVSLKAKDIRTVLKDKEKLIKNYKTNPFMFQLFAQETYNDYYQKGMINDDAKQLINPEQHYQQQLQNEQNQFGEDQSPIKKPYHMNVIASGGIDNKNNKNITNNEQDVPKLKFSPTKRRKQQKEQEIKDENDGVFSKFGKIIYSKFFGGTDQKQEEEKEQTQTIQNVKPLEQSNQDNQSKKQQFSVNFYTKSQNIAQSKSVQEKNQNQSNNLQNFNQEKQQNDLNNNINKVQLQDQKPTLDDFVTNKQNKKQSFNYNYYDATPKSNKNNNKEDSESQENNNYFLTANNSKQNLNTYSYNFPKQNDNSNNTNNNMQSPINKLSTIYNKLNTLNDDSYLKQNESQHQNLQDSINQNGQFDYNSKNCSDQFSQYNQNSHLNSIQNSQTFQKYDKSQQNEQLSPYYQLPSTLISKQNIKNSEFNIGEQKSNKN